MILKTKELLSLLHTCRFLRTCKVREEELLCTLLRLLVFATLEFVGAPAFGETSASVVPETPCSTGRPSKGPIRFRKGFAQSLVLSAIYIPDFIRNYGSTNNAVLNMWV